MTHSLEIIPGKSIGPFLLGMTIQEINDAIRALSPDPLTLQDLGMMATCHDERGNWKSLEGSDRCEQLEITVEKNQNAILLLGKSVNDIGRDAAWDLLSSLGSPIVRSLASYEVPEQGVRAIRWEFSDDEIYCFSVTFPTKPNVA